MYGTAGVLGRAGITQCTSTGITQCVSAGVTQCMSAGITTVYVEGEYVGLLRNLEAPAVQKQGKETLAASRSSPASSVQALTPAAKEGNVECGDGEGRCHSGVEAGIGGPRTGVRRALVLFIVLCCRC
jgi:hypothetical protein